VSEAVDIPVSIALSEPWQLANDPLAARVVLLRDDSLILRLDEPRDFQGEAFQFFVAQPRHEGSSVAELFEGRELHCALTAITAENARGPNPFDLSEWRGGLALIATLRTR
jgi:hypothetical protein